MAAHDLLERHQHIVREMVKIYKEKGRSSFDFLPTVGHANEVLFGRKPDLTVKATGQDLHVLEQEGLISLLKEERSGVKIWRGSIRRPAIEAVENNFKPPESSPTAGAVYQNFYAPV